MEDLFGIQVIVSANVISLIVISDISEYLDYENCKCRKKLFDKLIEECTENIDEVEIASENDHKIKCSSCILYIVLFSIILAINIGIGTYFVYYKYIIHNKENVFKYDYTYQKDL